jgi:hypothetical protein
LEFAIGGRAAARRSLEVKIDHAAPMGGTKGSRIVEKMTDEHKAK